MQERILAGRTAVVTGGAGGIGTATVRMLATSGASVVIADREDARAGAVADDVVRAGGRAVSVVADVRNEESVSALVTETMDHFGRLDILVNNAALTDVEAISQDDDLTDLDAQLWDDVHAVNVRGAMLMCKHALPHMVRAGKGAVVNVGSVDGLLGRGTRPAYSSSKAGLMMLTRSVATRFGQYGIRCNNVVPGLILTPAVERNMTAAEVEAAERHYLTARLGGPDDVAAAVTYLVSDHAGFVTGASLPVDGGATAHLAG